MKRRYNFSKYSDLRRVAVSAQIAYRKFTGDRSEQNQIDIAADVVAYFLSGKGQHQTIDQVVIELLRKRSGRKGSNSYERRRRICNAPAIGEDVFLYDRFSYNPELCVQGITEIISETPSKSKERFIAKLYYVWGLRQMEIADLLEVTESRVSQILMKFNQKLISTIKKKEKLNAISQGS